MLRPIVCAVLVACMAPAISTVRASDTPAEAPATNGPVELSEAASFLRIGERLVFKLGWGIVSGAGQTMIETLAPEAPGEPVRVRVVTESRGIVRALYPLQNDSTCYIDPQTGRPQRIEIRGHDAKREMRSTTIFDYEEGVVRHTDEIRSARSGTAELPDEPVYDIMVTMLKLRENPMKVGETRRVKIAFDDDIYDLELKALEQDRIRTPMGRFEAVAIQPEQKGELKGFFAKGGSMKFWLSTEGRPQIVRMDFRVKIGTVTGALMEEEEGSSPHEDPRP